MPRAKPRRGPGAVIVAPLKLARTPNNIEAVQTCYDLAWLEPTSQSAKSFWRRVGETLEAAPAWKTLEADSPRPASERASLARVSAPIANLKAAMEDLAADTLTRLYIAGADTQALRGQLDAFERAITIAEFELQGVHLRKGKWARVKPVESRGAAPQRWRRITVNLLAATFQEYEQGPSDDYAERLRNFLLAAATLIDLDLPRPDRVLALVNAPLKVHR